MTSATNAYRDDRFVLSETQALAAWKIMVEECGESDDELKRNYFLNYVTTKPGQRKVFRFQGSLGFGGKFRLNSNRNFAPYVDCYREDETPKRLAAIERANARLLSMWSAQ